MSHLVDRASRAVFYVSSAILIVLSRFASFLAEDVGPLFFVTSRKNVWPRAAIDRYGNIGIPEIKNVQEFV